MIIEQSAVDINFVDASRGAIKIQQSIQQSLVNIDLDYTDTKSKDVNVEQSAVNIDLW